MLAGGQNTDGVEKVRALGFAAWGGWSPKCHALMRVRPESPWELCCRFGVQGQTHKMEWEHLLLLTNAQRYTARQPLLEASSFLMPRTYF